jgi:hypothetical protein
VQFSTTAYRILPVAFPCRNQRSCKPTFARPLSLVFVFFCASDGTECHLARSAVA